MIKNIDELFKPVCFTRKCITVVAVNGDPKLSLLLLFFYAGPEP